MQIAIDRDRQILYTRSQAGAITVWTIKELSHVCGHVCWDAAVVSNYISCWVLLCLLTKQKAGWF